MRIILAILAACFVTNTCVGDSIFDTQGVGRDIIPAAGMVAPLGGAALPLQDEASASLLSPFAAAYADRITITGGFTHTSTKSTYSGGTEHTITTMFPSLSIVIPFKGVSLLTGLFEEKLGRVELTATDTAHAQYVYTVEQTRKSSIHSVPILVSAKLGRRLVISGGFIFSFFDTRYETSTEFAGGELKDTEDIFDMSADGKSFGIGLLADLDRLNLGFFYRAGADLSGDLQAENRYAGIYSTRNVEISSEESWNVGMSGKLLPWLGFVASYYQSPWTDLRLDSTPLTASSIERWSLGIRYEGNHFWKASRYPLLVGYYRQPLDWPRKGNRIYQQAFSLGTVIPIGEERGLLTLSVEIGSRKDGNTSLKENYVGFSCSISAKEVWRREVRR